MLRLNRETDYAIRVILALAKYPPGKIIPSSVIRQEMGLPFSLSLQIISHLSNLKLINSYPGRNGGIQLAYPPAEISLLEVIQAMEGPLVLSDCLENGGSCELEQGCPVRRTLIEVQELIQNELEKVNFNSLTLQQPQRSTKVVQ